MGSIVVLSLAILPPADPSLLSRLSPLSRRAVLATGVGGAAGIAAGLPAPALADSSAVYRPAPGSLAGTTVLITGANTGLGLESAKRLAAGGANVVVTARTQAKAEDAARKVSAEASEAQRVTAVSLDLADLRSVRTLPTRLDAALGAKEAAIDVLLNNAGVMAIPQHLVTADGFEKTVGINHLGHFALVAALLPALKRSAAGFRIITVSSDAHRLATSESIKAALDANLDPEYAAAGWGNYGLSKAANVLFTVEMQSRIEAAGLKGSAVSLHPGVVQTDLGRFIMGGVGAEDVRLSETAAAPTGVGKLLKETLLDKVVIPVEVGANTQVFLAAAADAGGDRARRPKTLYFDKMKAVKPNDAAADPALAKRLWEISETLTGATVDL
mmetsp:Transcript_23323/g.74718  ORF Transcript_23323/g.74718 Transcript_23323/m.74718 type:complete len:386 (+) Transcript_23323:1-1158(+)